MKHIWKNIRGLWKNERLLFAVMIVCVFSSALLLQFAYGLYQNYHVQRVEAEEDLKNINAQIAEGETMNIGEMRRFVEALPEDVSGSADCFLCPYSLGKLSDHITMTPELEQKFTELFGKCRIWYDAQGEAVATEFDVPYEGKEDQFQSEEEENEWKANYEQQLRSEYGDDIVCKPLTPDTPLSDWCMGGGDDVFFYRDGEYGYYPARRETTKKESVFVSGGLYTDAQIAAGENVCIVSRRLLKKEAMVPNADFLVTTEFLQQDENTLMLYGKPCKIVGITNEQSIFGHVPTVPFTVLPDTTRVSQRGIGIHFPRNITRKTYDTIKETAEQVIPGKLVFAEMQFPDKDSIYLYNNIMLISALIAVLSVLNFVMLYHFILKRRSRSLAVYRMAGCSAGKAVRIYLGECFTISIPVYLLGLAVYIPLMKRVFSKIFPYMEESYNRQVYAAIFGMYLLTMFVMLTVMVTRHVRQSIWKEWGNGV